MFKNKKRLNDWSRSIVTTLLIAGLAVPSALADEGQWKHFGQSLNNDRHNKSENKIGVENAANLEVLWKTDLVGDVWATPAVKGNGVYFPDDKGFLYKLNRKTGEIIWQKNIVDYSSKPTQSGNFSRTTPAIQGTTLVIGDQGNRFPFYNNFDINQAIGAEVMAVNTETGEPVWTTVVDDHPFSIITTSATIYQNTVLVGVSSYESAFAAYIQPLPGFPPETQPFLSPFYQPSSNGSMVALDLKTGEIKWKTNMTTAEFSGASIWGSSPSVDVKRGQVFVGTGQNFSMPADVQNCALDAFAEVDNDPVAGAEAARKCLENYPDNYFDSIVALDIKTGHINWANRIVGYDVWHVACLFGIDFICPNPAGLDADFGQSPIFFSIQGGKNAKGKGPKQDVIGVGQKTGDYWVFDAVSGDLVWRTKVSPGGIAGGIQWGSAYDGERIYTSSANSDNIPFELIDGTTATGGIWSALDPQSGEILWQVAAPITPSTPPNPFTGEVVGPKSGGAASVANDVVYVCSWDDAGTMYALNANNGNILWNFESGGTCNSGAAISNGAVFWGSGYQSFGSGTTSNAIRAFSTN